MNRSPKRLWWGVGIVGVSLIAVFAFAFLNHDDVPPVPPSSSATFTNPTLNVVENKNLSIGARLKLQEELRVFAEEEVSKGTLTNYGLYFRELMGGPVIALRQSEGFFPASLLKIPVALWYYKQAEQNPALFTEEIQFTGPKGVSVEAYMPKHSIEPGTIYTIEELIRFMLAESDNDATQILVEYAGGRESINQVYRDLGIDDIENYSTYTMDVQTYAAFFRVLFNSEYLTREYSERVLSTLAESSFVDGLVVGLPVDIAVAHKFGERTPDPSRDIDQLHDCGIVYYPNNPYLLCIMTQGHNYEEQAHIIAELSLRVYEAVRQATI